MDERVLLATPGPAASVVPPYFHFLANYSDLFRGPKGQFLLNMTRYNRSLFPLPGMDGDGDEAAYPDVACVSMDVNDPELMLSHQVYAFTSLIFVVIGLVGNALSIMVFGSKAMRDISSNVYLLFLAISDSLYLISVFSTKILTTLRCLYFVDEALDISNRSTVLCKLFQYLLDLFSDYSTGLILAFTVERYIACYHPLNFKEICTVWRARIACASLFAVVAIFIAPYHFMFIGRLEGYDYCTVLIEKEAEFTILYIVEAMLFRVVPVFVIAVLNVFIIVKVTKVSRDKQRRSQGKSAQQRRRSVKEDKHRQLTIMLILVSSSYIIAYLPVLVHFVMWKLRRSQMVTVSERALDITQNYAKPMYIFGFAINFFLYTMSGRVFREQLILMLCGKKRLRCAMAEPTTENTALHHQQRQPLTTMNGDKHHDAAAADDADAKDDCPGDAVTQV
jgi:hypothetical protein